MKLSSAPRSSGHELEVRNETDSRNANYDVGLPPARPPKPAQTDLSGLRRNILGVNVTEFTASLGHDDVSVQGSKNARGVKSFVDIVASEALPNTSDGKGRGDTANKGLAVVRTENQDTFGTAGFNNFVANRASVSSTNYNGVKCEIKVSGNSGACNSLTSGIQNWITPPATGSHASCVIPVMPGNPVFGSDSTLRSALAETKPTNDAVPGLHTYGFAPESSSAKVSAINWNTDSVKDVSGLSREAVNRLKEMTNAASKSSLQAETTVNTCVSIPVESSSCIRGQSSVIGPLRKTSHENGEQYPFHSVTCNVTSSHVSNALPTPSMSVQAMSFVPNQNNSHGSEHVRMSSNPFVNSMQSVPQKQSQIPASIMTSPLPPLPTSVSVNTANSGVDVNLPEVVVTQNVESSNAADTDLQQVNIARTLISKGAQTDNADMGRDRVHHATSTSAARQHREVRKRERRERRRDRNETHCRHSTSSGTSTSHRHHSRRHSSHQTHSLAESHSHTTSDRLSECSRSTANLNPPPPSLPAIESSQRTSNHAAEVLRNVSDQVPSNVESEVATQNAEIPDLMPTQPLPPIYSTLPPNYDRRLTQVPLPYPIISMPIVSNVAAPHGTHMQIPMQLPIPPHTASALLVQPPSNCLPSQAQPSVRYHFPTTARASRRSVGAPRGVPYPSDEEPKSCCGIAASQTVSMRWFIVVIAIIGISCTVAGTALGAAYSNGREQLTYSLLMIGVGVVLLTVSAVAWRITSHETESTCRAMFGFTRSAASRGDGGTEPNRRFMPRLNPGYGRPHHPYAAMMYPEFQYRPPPPSYQASMQEYRLRLLLLERSNPTFTTAPAVASPASYALIPPPPAYRPYSGGMPGGLSQMNDPDYSRPPSYRSRSSGNSGHVERASSRPSMDPSGGLHHTLQHHVVLDSPLHSRNPSLLSYLSQQSVADNVSVVSGRCIDGRSVGPADSTVVTVMRAVSVGMDLGIDMGLYDPDCIEHLPIEEEDKTSALHAGEKDVITKDSESADSNPTGYNKDGNLVRIVQTTDSSQVIGRDSVIVTVSGSNNSLWNQSLQLTNNQNVQSNAVQSSNQQNSSHQDGNPSTFQRSAGSNNMQNVISNSEVQILAHL